ncbi:MAG: family 16 glycoside hydrolase [Akkermansiaceae bacterium]
MKRTMKFFLLCKVFLCMGLSADTISLFDGETLDGWEGDSRFWSVQDGVITGKSTEAVPCKQTTYLSYTKKEFANFEFTVAFRFLTENGNGGIQYRSAWMDEGKTKMKGYQADLETGKRFSGILYEENGRGMMAKRGEKVLVGVDGKKTVEKLADAEKAQASIKHGEWNTYRVVADGQKLMHEINGFKTVEVVDNEKNRKAAKGILALQMHQGVPVTVQYKDVKMLELADTKLASTNPQVIQPVATPEWIWGGDPKVKSEGKQTFTFTKEFELDQFPKRCYLAINADNSAIVRLNNRKIVTPDNWRESAVADVANHINKGKNTLSIRVTNDGDLGGFVLQLSDILVSDDSWVCVDNTTKKEIPTFSHGKHGMKPWGKVLVDLQEEVPDELRSMDGFKVEKIYSVNKETEGSWVSMCFDDKGQLFISDQYGSLYKIILKDGEIQSKEKLEGLGHAQGLCWAYGSLYVVSSNRKDPGVHRMTDTNSDGNFDKSELILPIIGGGEHGTHGLIKNPNGEGLLFIVGNHTHPPKDATNITNKNWGEDTLHPHLNDASGHAVGVKAPGGTLILLSADGKERRVLATGMRNTYDIAASPTGEVYGYDSDMEYDVGTPWYKPTRVLHYIEGAEYGWRTGTAKWPEYYADSLGSVIDIGPGCPTGVLFGTGAKFPAKYQKALYILDWTFGRIYALHLSPDGTTYTAAKEVFVSGKPLPLTDATIGPDGSMYFLTGGRRLRSALYRVDYDGSESTAPVAVGTVTAAQKKLKQIQESKDVAELWENVGSADRTLRYAARVSMEQIPTEKWVKKYQAESDPQTLITSSLALSRNKAEPQVIIDKLLEIDFDKLDEAMKLEYLRAVSLVFIRNGKPEEQTRMKLLEKFNHYPSSSMFVNRELCRVLVYLDSKTVLPQTLFLMNNSIVVKEDIPEDLLEGHDKYGKDIQNMLANQPDSQALHYALMLKNQKSGWNKQTVTDYYKWLAKAESKTGGNSYKGFIKNIRSEAMKNIEAKPELVELAKELSTVVPAAQPMEFAKGPGRNWSAEEALAAVEDLSKADVANGKKMFQAVHCAKCHSHSGEGGSSGPELTQLANRFSKKDILKAIIDPSEVISDQYQSTILHLDDETTIAGKIMKEDDEHIYLASNPFDLTVHTPVLQSSVVKRTVATTSTMPPSLINAMNPDELRDLMLYLTNQSN